jgi:hypothetical protein
MSYRPWWILSGEITLGEGRLYVLNDWLRALSDGDDVPHFVSIAWCLINFNGRSPMVNMQIDEAYTCRVRECLP